VLPPGPTGKTRADGARTKFLRGATAMQELFEPMITGDPYPIKGLIVYGSSLFHTVPNVPRTKQALENLDLVVAIDVLPQDHLAWADVVLPEAIYLERYDELWACSHKTPYIALREPAVAPLGDTKPAWWMARELGMRLGLKAYFTWETAEQYLDTRLQSVGLSIQKLREQNGIAVQKGKPYLEDWGDESPFATPSGMIELFASTLAEAGFDPLPQYEAVDPPPAGFFRLLYGRHPVHTFARTQNTPALHMIFAENEVWLNDAVAAQLGLRDGARITLENQDGVREGPVKLKVTPRIRPDAVYMVHGFGHRAPQMRRANAMGASDTVLQTRYALDPISGGAGMRINFVRIVQEG
jgi:thiosulfate reductase/polysulfide reductase chain A